MYGIIEWYHMEIEMEWILRENQWINWILDSLYMNKLNIYNQWKKTMYVLNIFRFAEDDD